MTERESNYQVGRFTSMNRTRDAFTGNVREKINIRAQQIAAEQNGAQPAQTFNREQVAAKTAVINTQEKLNKEEIQSAWKTYGQMEQNHLQTEFQLQVDAQLPWEIDQKLGKMGKEQVLSAIQARKTQAEKTIDTATATAQEQALTQEQIKLEADKLLAMAPEALLAGSIATLAVWVINRLPNKVYKVAAIGAILSLILSACSTVNRTPTTEIPTFTGPTAAETTATPEGTTAAIISTATAETAKTQEVSRAGAFLEAYLAGQSIDVSQLSPTEYKEFSIKLTEKMNEQRGVNPILYKDEAYVHPDNLMMFDYDGHPDMNETITMYLAIAGRDSEGNLQIINEKGQTVTIANSADVDWNMIVTDPNDPRIDFANTGGEYEPGVSNFQNIMTLLNPDLIPMILLDKSAGLIYFDVDKGGTRALPIYQFLKIETDQNNNPIIAKKILIFPGDSLFSLYEESLSTEEILYNSKNENINDSKLHKSLTENTVYYIFSKEDQNDFYKKRIFANLDHYTGLMHGNEAFSNLIKPTHNDDNIIILGNYGFIKKTGNN